MSGSKSRTGGKNGKDSSTRKGAKTMEKNSSLFGRYSDAELVSQLKVLALDPCHPDNSRTIQPLWNQIIRVRKAMALNDHQFPRRKRQLQQFVKEKLTALPGPKSESSSLTNHPKLRKGPVSHASSASCLRNSVLSAESIDQKILSESHSSSSVLTLDNDILMKQILSNSSSVDDATKCNSFVKNMSISFDPDESVNIWNVSPESSILEAPSKNLDEISHTSSSVVTDKNRKYLQPVRRSSTLLNFIGDDQRRIVVPVGPRFQVDVTDWVGPCNGESSDSDVLRWLGTRIWPLEDGTRKFDSRAIGKGRPKSCSCLSPLSVECIRRHVLEERLRLQCDIGTAFFTWKFDEMGDQVSSSWTLQEQQKFESLARKKQAYNGNHFVKHALKCFPLKCRKTILSYYFNVYIPRQMSLQRKLSLKEIDSDGDEVEDCDSSDKQNNDGKASANGKSKQVKSRYLRRPC